MNYILTSFQIIWKIHKNRYKKTSVLISFIGPSLLFFENKIVSMHKIIKYI